jgi:hypothetical protein
MFKTNVTWSGSYDDEDVTVDFIATGTHYYSPGCMYRRNGDPGDPPEDDYEVESIDITSAHDDNGECLSRLTDAKIGELEEKIASAIDNGDYEPEDDYMDPEED